MKNGEHELTLETCVSKKKIVETSYHFKHTSDEIVLVDAGEEGKFVKIRSTPDNKEDGKDVLYLRKSFLKIISDLIKANPELIDNEL